MSFFRFFLCCGHLPRFVFGCALWSTQIFKRFDRLSNVLFHECQWIWAWVPRYFGVRFMNALKQQYIISIASSTCHTRNCSNVEGEYKLREKSYPPTHTWYSIYLFQRNSFISCTCWFMSFYVISCTAIVLFIDYIHKTLSFFDCFFLKRLSNPFFFLSCLIC